MSQTITAVIVSQLVNIHQGVIPKEEIVPDLSPLKTHQYQQDTSVELTLLVTDPEIADVLSAFSAGRSRENFALSALRIGILALKQAEGQVDANAVRNEGERIMSTLQQHLSEHQNTVTLQIANSIKEYFDPAGGRFNERLERLLKEDGELEQVIRRQIGQDESELTKTLAAHFGESSPIMQALDPEATDGILTSIQTSVNTSLKTGTDGILKEFSLDNKESALSRLVSELTEKHGKLTGDLQGSIKDVVTEFSLDNEDSALSRLIRRVETAQKQISDEFSLDTESSALARMKREMVEILSTHKKDSTEFQQEVREALADMKARKEESKRSTTHGNVFEDDLLKVTQDLCKKSDDIVTHVGNTTGLIKNCKVGDILIELGPEHVAAGSKIVIEAKQSSSYDMTKARSEIETARKNRGSDVGIFVFSKATVPDGVEQFTRIGNDIYIIWDAEDSGSDVILVAAISVARALSTRIATQRDEQTADFDSIERAIRNIEKQAQDLDQITGWANTIKSNSGKILDRTRIMKENMEKQIEVIDENVKDLKEVLGNENSGS